MSRRTEQREAIFDALRASDRAVTAQELHGQLEGVGLATVYRNLQRLAETGDADTLRRDNGEVAFLICDHCGGVDEMSSSGVAGAISDLLADEGFEPQRQILEISGRCAHCGGQAHAA